MKKTNWLLIALVVLIVSPLLLPLQQLAFRGVIASPEAVAETPQIQGEQTSSIFLKAIKSTKPDTPLKAIIREAISQQLAIKGNKPLKAVTVPTQRTLDSSKPTVALTFDDGPYTPVTDRILNQLETYGGKATFFIVGNRLGQYHASVERALSLGCEIGNHTYTHSNLTKLNADKVFAQMNDADYSLWYYTGQVTHTMRPVGGSHNKTVQESVGKPIIMWSLDTQDWKSRNATAIANAVLNKVQDGDIILMHDLYTTTADACEIIIPELINRGYQLATVSELAAVRGITLEAGTAYNKLPLSASN